MEICLKCNDPLVTHGSCCRNQIQWDDESTGYYWPPGNYRMIAGKIYRIIDSSSKDLFSPVTDSNQFKGW